LDASPQVSASRSAPARAARGATARPILTTVFGVVLALLVACTPAAPATPVSIPPDASSSVGPPATGTPSAAPSEAAFPITLTDDEGTTVTIPDEPERIASLTPATTEILFALGVEDRIVAKSEDVANYPPESAEIPDVATFGSVDVERIVDLETDLVVAGGNDFVPADAIARLRTLDIPVVVVYAPDVETVFHDIELTGQAVGEPAEAQELADELRAEFDAVGDATEGLEPPRVFYELDATGAIYGPADRSFLAEMIELAGGDPITTGSPDKFDIPLERLIEADPEVILLGDAAYGVTVEQVAERPGWNVMTAVREGEIRPVEDIVITRPGPRIGEGLRGLAEAIHPDLDL
jgi:iron complex transport system substrate-binding protein